MHGISSYVFSSFRIARKSINSIVSRYIKSTAEKLRTVMIQPRLTEKPISHIYRPQIDRFDSFTLHQEYGRKITNGYDSAKVNGKADFAYL